MGRSLIDALAVVEDLDLRGKLRLVLFIERGIENPGSIRKLAGLGKAAYRGRWLWIYAGCLIHLIQDIRHITWRSVSGQL